MRCLICKICLLGLPFAKLPQHCEPRLPCLDNLGLESGQLCEGVTVSTCKPEYFRDLIWLHFSLRNFLTLKAVLFSHMHLLHTGPLPMHQRMGHLLLLVDS